MANPYVELRRQCDEITQWVPSYQVKLMIEDHARLVQRVNAVGLHNPTADAAQFQAQWTAALTQHLVPAACGWVGVVEVETGDGIGVWNCPRCGAQHEDDRL